MSDVPKMGGGGGEVDEDKFPKVKKMVIRVKHKPLGERNNSIS